MARLTFVDCGAWIAVADLRAYRQREYHSQRQVMADLSRIGEELVGYEAPEVEVARQ